MASGGYRSNAGRKSTWVSGRAFKDTATIRVPKEFKETLLEIAKKLDAGEPFDLDTKTKADELQELKSKLLEVELRKQQLNEDVKKYHLDLETKSKEFQLKIEDLERENSHLQSLINNNQSISGISPSVFVDLIADFVQKWQKKIKGLTPLDTSSKAHQMLFDLQKIIYDEKAKLNIAINLKTNIGSSVINLNTETKSKNESFDIETKSINSAQLELLDLKSDNVAEYIKPLASAELSKRFNKPDGFVKTKKYQLKHRPNDFLALLKNSDPQNIGWKYSEKDKKYHPIFENQDLKLEV